MACDVFSTNLRVAVGKLETTPGTAETLASADFNVRARSPEFAYTIETDGDSKFASGDHREDERVPGKRTGSVNLNLKLTPGSSASTAPKWSKFAKACGLKEVAYTTAGIGWQPLKEMDCTTMTIGVYDIQRGATPAAVSNIIAGAMGTLSIAADGVGKPVMMSMAFQGKYQGLADVANANIPALTSPDTTLAPAFQGGSLTIASYSAKVQSFSLDTGNGLQMVDDASQATGIVFANVATRQPRLTVTILRDTASDFNDFTKITAQTLEALTLTVNTAATVDMSLYAPKAQLMNANPVDVNGTVGLELSYDLLYGDGTILSAECPWELLQGARA